jgi:hypothetical protein
MRLSLREKGYPERSGQLPPHGAGVTATERTRGGELSAHDRHLVQKPRTDATSPSRMEVGGRPAAYHAGMRHEIFTELAAQDALRGCAQPFAPGLGR